MAERLPTSSESKPFNPADPDYKRVADLPEGVRDQYADLPKGGFVRKSVLEYEQQIEARADREVEQSLGTVVGWLSHLWGRHRREKEKLVYEGAEDERPVDVLIKNATTLLHDQLYASRYEVMRKGLDERSATGALYKRRDGACGGYVIWGMVNGRKIDFHRCGLGASRDEGTIDDVRMDRATMEDFDREYDSIALPIELVERDYRVAKTRVADEIQDQYGHDPEMTLSKQQQAQEEGWRKARETREEEDRLNLRAVRESLFGRAAP